MANEVVVRLAEAVNVLVGARRELKDHVLRASCSLSEVALLSRLDSAGPQRVTQLAELVGVDASVVSRQVAALVQHGLAVRAPDPDDGRSHLVAATATGLEVLAEARVRLHDSWHEALSGWTPQELDTLATGMARLGADLTTARTHRIDRADRPQTTDGPETDRPETTDIRPDALEHTAVLVPAGNRTTTAQESVRV